MSVTYNFWPHSSPRVASTSWRALSLPRTMPISPLPHRSTVFPTHPKRHCYSFGPRLKRKSNRPSKACERSRDRTVITSPKTVNSIALESSCAKCNNTPEPSIGSNPTRTPARHERARHPPGAHVARHPEERAKHASRRAAQNVARFACSVLMMLRDAMLRIAPQHDRGFASLLSMTGSCHNDSALSP